MATFLSSRLKTLRVGIQGYTDNTEVAQFIGNINIDGSVKVNTFDDGLSTGSSNYVITADGAGGWSWKSIIDVGAVTSPGGTDGQVQYNNNGSIGGAAQLYYDDVNSRVGVGTNSPGYLFEVNGDASFLGAFRDNDGDTGAEGQILMSTGSGINWVNAAPAAAITGLNIKEESVLQGEANAIATLDFVGSYITATVAGSVATITMTESPDFTGLTVNSNTVWHAGNDGVDSGLDADLLDGQQGSYYLDYTNFTNIPTIGNGLITISTGSGLTGSGNFTVNQSGATTITVSHADTSTQTSVNNANGVVIQDITLDGFGHITAIGSIDLDLRYLGINAKAADSDLLDGQDGSYYLNTSATAQTKDGDLSINGYIKESTDNGTTYWNVVTQSDIGYGAAQVPLNQYLGQLAFLDDYHPNGLRRDGGGSDDVFVDASGNVGIGTTLPTTTLDVNGTFKVSGNATFQGNVNLGDADAIVFGDGGDLRIFSGGNNSFIQETSASGNLYIDSTNLVLRNGAGNETLASFLTDGAVDLYFDDALKFSTTSTGIDVTGHIETDTLNVSGNSTFQGNVTLGDNDKAIFGDGNDLQIYHQGTNSYIDDVGDGSLIIRSNFIDFKNPTGTERYAYFQENNAVALYFDDSKKFETTAAGVSISNGVSTSATITGPAELIIDPAVVGDNTGLVRIKGDLYVDGTTTQINSTSLEIADFVVGIASTATTDLLADGAGIQIGPDNTFLYEYNGGTNPSLQSSENLSVATGKVYQIGTTQRLSADTLSLGSGTTIYSPSNQVLTLGTGGAERIRINNVGDINLNISTGFEDEGILKFGRSDGTLRDHFIRVFNSTTAASNYMKFDVHNGTLTTGGLVDATTVLTLLGNGNVGIGTTTPSSQFVVSNGGAAGLEIQSTGFSSAPVIVSYNRSSSAYTQLTLDGSSNVFAISGIEKARITSDGKLGVGTSAPTNVLEVQGTATSNLFAVKGASGGDALAITARAAGNGAIVAALNNAQSDYEPLEMNGEFIYFQTRTGAGTVTERVRIDSSGRLLVGTSTARSTWFQTAPIQNESTGAAGISLIRNSADTLGSICVLSKSRGTSNGSATIVAVNDQIGTIFWTAADGTDIETAAASIGCLVDGIPDVDDMPGRLVFSTTAAGASSPTERMRINSAGNVGIGASNPQHKLEVAGSFAATTKSFVIPHPTKEDMKLRYGSLEGPENGVYVRGKTDGFVIDLPDYWTGLVDEDSITVSLTAIGKAQTLWVKDIKDNKVFVGSKCSTVKYFYTIFAERKDVEKLEVEF